MKILIKRLHRTDKSTIGELSIDGAFECYTLEDVERDVKIKSETAIQKGVYKCVITYSNRFKKYMPLLLNVPNFKGIRIHTGNTNNDTEGCILVGNNRGLDFISNSRIAYNNLLEKLKKAEKKEEIIIHIE